MSVTDDDVTAADTVPAAPAGGVRWKRFAAMLGLTGAVTAALVTLTAQGVLAANFSISGMPFKVTADRLDGHGFQQWATIDEMAGGDKNPNAGDSGGQLFLLVSAINKAELTKLCQSVDLGAVAIKITAGDNGTPVKATALVVDSDLITGDADFSNINVGQDASTFNQVIDPKTGKPITGPLGVFGQQADNVVITNLMQNNYSTTASVFTLPHLRMALSTSGGC